MQGIFKKLKINIMTGGQSEEHHHHLSRDNLWVVEKHLNLNNRSPNKNQHTE